MGYRTIVMGTDGSATAGIAQHAATYLAKRFKANLILVSAFGPPKITRPMAEAAMRYAQESAQKDGISPALVLREGAPEEVILDVATQQDADLLVVGNKGIGQATRFRLGSVPDRVAHYAPCDLLIVDTTRKPEARDASRRYRNLLVGTDGSPTAGEAARKALELGMMLRAGVRIIYVGDPIVGAIRVEETAAAAPEGVTVTPHITDGEPTERILEVADEEGIDLIVVGNKGMSGARRFLLGSVPNKVAHYASTDVLIVKTVDRTLADLAPGSGGVFEVKGQRSAVYRDPDGTLHAVSAKCTHMGCTVDWNPGDRTWDCPCHGSRYGVDGGVIRGPAERALAPVELEG